MFCKSCGRKMHSPARFCEHCGGVQVPPKVLAVPAKATFAVLLLGIGCLSLCSAIVIFAIISGHSQPSTQPQLPDERASINADDGSPSPSPSSSETQLVSRIPPSAHVTIHAYDLLKNPYAYQGEMVQLNCSDLAFLIGENLSRYFEPPAGVDVERIQGRGSVRPDDCQRRSGL